MHLERLLDPYDGVYWSVEIREVTTGSTVHAFEPHLRLRTASIAKVHLLVEVADRFVTGELDPLQPLDRRSVTPVRDYGLWQHLSSDVLPAIDVARLIGAVSDNLATNVLLDVVGLEAVQARGQRIAPDGSVLYDIVRDVRGADDPPALSEGTAADWSGLFAGLANGSAADPATCALVRDWLRTGVDLSLVAAALGLDPLAHFDGTDRGVELWNKTGTDAGVRGEVGVVGSGGGRLAYAVLCNWDETAVPDRRDHVLGTMRRVGAAIRSLLDRGVTRRRSGFCRGCR